MVVLVVATSLLLGDGSTVHQHNVIREPTAADSKLLEKWLAHRRKILNECEPLIVQAKKASAAPANKNSLERARADKAEFQLQVAFAEALTGEMPPPPLDWPLTLGDIGTLPGYRFRLIQRLGKSEARVGIRQPPKQQGLDFVLRRDGKLQLPEVEVVLTGFDLSNVIDGKECETAGCFIVSKAKTETLAGNKSRTAFVIEPYDPFVAQRRFMDEIFKGKSGLPTR